MANQESYNTYTYTHCLCLQAHTLMTTFDSPVIASACCFTAQNNTCGHVEQTFTIWCNEVCVWRGNIWGRENVVTLRHTMATFCWAAGPWPYCILKYMCAPQLRDTVWMVSPVACSVFVIVTVTGAEDMTTQLPPCWPSDVSPTSHQSQSAISSQFYTSSISFL